MTIFYAPTEIKPIELTPHQLAFILRTVEGCLLNAQRRVQDDTNHFYTNVQLKTALRLLSDIVPQVGAAE
jgi:hypothetical protein